MIQEKPASWARSTLEMLAAKVTDGSHNPPKKAESGLPMLSCRNIKFNNIVFDEYRLVSKEEFIKEDQRTKVSPGDVVLSIVGTIGESAVVLPDTAKFVCQRSMAVIGPCPELNSDFLNYYFKSPEAISYFVKNAKGTTQKGIYLKALRSMDLYLPPIGEQKRIVSKVETCLEKVDATDEALKKAEDLIGKYKEALLAKAFRGELVPQDPNEEPASQLLERIRAEKDQADTAKKRKKKIDIAPITDDEKPFDLPESWEWVRPAEVLHIQSGASPKGLPSSSDGTDVPFVKVGDMNNSNDGRFIDSIGLHLSTKTFEKLKIKTLPAGSIIFPKRGGAILTNKKRQLLNEAPCDTNIMGLVLHPLLHDYFWAWFETIDLSSLHTGSTIPQINNGDIEKLVIPIPPASEQKRILDKLKMLECKIDNEMKKVRSLLSRTRDSILSKAFCGELVQQIESEGTGHQLLEEVLAEKAKLEANKPKKKKAKKKTRKKKS